MIRARPCLDVTHHRLLTALLLVLAAALLLPGAALAQLSLPVVDGVRGAGSVAGGMLKAKTWSDQEVARTAAKQAAAIDTYFASKDLTINYFPDVGDTLCRLSTTQGPMSLGMEWYRRGVGQSLEAGVDNLATNKNISPTRLAVGWLYRLCKSGQLRRGTEAANYSDSDFGPKWFDMNRCIEDRTQAHAFLRPSTILEHSVLISPTQEQLETLNNPANYDPVDGGVPLAAAGTPATVWAALSDKQKLFVGAKLFCENLIMSRIYPIDFTSDQAMMPDNMRLITTRYGAHGQLTAAAELCRSELARRTAPDPSAPQYAGIGVMEAIAGRREKIGLFLVEHAGKNPVEVLAYATEPVIGTIIPGSERGGFFVSQYLLDRYNSDYCNNTETAANFSVKAGTVAEHSTLVLDCLEIEQNWEFNEATNRLAFVQAVLGLPDIGSTPGPTAAPTKVRYDGGPIRHEGPREGLWRGAFLEGLVGDQPTKLSDVIKAIDAAAHPAKVAVAEGGAQP